MKRIYPILTLLLTCTACVTTAFGQNNWPQSVTTNAQDQVKMYQWEFESATGDVLKAKAAISIDQKDKDDLVFGMSWLTVTVNRSGGVAKVVSANIDQVKLPGVGESKQQEIQSALEAGISQWNLSFNEADLKQPLEIAAREKSLSSSFNNTPPKIIYSNRPSLLVSIDGTPRFQKNEAWGVDVVMNSPYTIIRNTDGAFYLYGSNHWYTAPAVTGSYRYTSSVPENLAKIESAVDEANKKNNPDASDEAQTTNDNVIPNIITSTEPAELVQSDGEANFSPIANTGLLYVSNSANDIFMDINSQSYFVLLSGRWYKAKTLTGHWEYVASDKLPGDFARIPDDSPKSGVLSSVAGTDEANEALADAEVPQTAKVDRRSTEANITYDGDPQFDDIDGTEMDYAINSSASVIRWHGRYYAVDNGVWFESRYPSGPWEVSVRRPSVVSLIPPRYPVYNMKYVYIYDVYPDYVYVGYTPGYLNTYIYGPTIVYGTGYYYDSWYGDYYYARPWTWGFGMRYSPWTGWGFSLNLNFGWFNCGYGYGSWPRYWGGWWGPYRYRPSYCWSGYRGSPYRGGYNYYGGNYRYRNANYGNSGYRTNTVYRDRPGIVSRNYAGNLNRSNRISNGGFANRDNNRNNRPYVRNGQQDFNNNSNNRNYSDRTNRPSRNLQGNNNNGSDNRNRGENGRQWQRPFNNNNNSSNNSGTNERQRTVREPRDYSNDRGNRTPNISAPQRQERGGGSSQERPRVSGGDNQNSGRGGGQRNDGGGGGGRSRRGN